ncbi:sugar-binding protein [Maribacter sp. 2210JD10-5]|uniref:sugar-binding protein n=1 Tax=Maribacter sp. 2210JD10-5 TaxID=3386272 RepID=UPI0039BD54AE
MKTTLLLVFLIMLCACSAVHKKQDTQITEVIHIETAPVLDGKAMENFWNLIEWQSIDQNWIGGPYEHEDFNGKYKLAWNENALYILLEITDDVLYDKNEDPLKLWWNDDCVEIFIDEDNSGGLHQFNYNAFAYHVALDGNVVDITEEEEPALFNEHVTSAHTTEGNLSTWELEVKIFDEDFYKKKVLEPTILKPDKKIGFALAYCDNDQSVERENFIGSIFVPGEDKNQGWINADIFGTLVLKK